MQIQIFKPNHIIQQQIYQVFNQSITLSQVFQQAGNDSTQVKFQDALLQLCTYDTCEQDYNLLLSRAWDHLTVNERHHFDNVLHLLQKWTAFVVTARHTICVVTLSSREDAKH